MKLSKRDLMRVAWFFAALIMIAVGFILCRLGSRGSSPTEADRTPAAAQVQASLPGPREAPSEDPVTMAEPGEPAADASRESRRPQAEDQPTPAQSSVPARPASPRKTVPSPKAVSEAYLPPFQPGLDAAAAEESIGPPPDVLWLSGVIQGKPNVAVVRRGDNRYLVREGDTIEGVYRVVSISSDKITLQRGSRNKVLRIGEY